MTKQKIAQLLKIIAILSAVLGFSGLVVVARIEGGGIAENTFTDLLRMSIFPAFIVAFVTGITHVSLQNSVQDQSAPKVSFGRLLIIITLTFFVCVALIYAGLMYILSGYTF